MSVVPKVFTIGLQESTADAMLGTLAAVGVALLVEARAVHDRSNSAKFFDSPTRKRCHEAATKRRIAALSPSCASEMISFTPVEKEKRHQLRSTALGSASNFRHSMWTCRVIWPLLSQ